MIETARTSARTEGWPLTREAFDALALEIDRLVADLAAAPGLRATDPAALEERGSTALDGVPVPLPIDFARAQRRLEALAAIREAASVVDDPGVAAAGRRVTLSSDDEGIDAARDAMEQTYSLVLPGDGDPALGWVSMTSPLGAALLGRRAGERVSVHAPAGEWTATILAVE